MTPRNDARFVALVATAFFALLGPPAMAASGSYALEGLDVSLPECVEIAEREEGALLFNNGCARAFSIAPVDSDCPGCDPALTLQPGEIGWYGLASPSAGDGARIAGPRVATWFEEGGRSGALTARLVYLPAEMAGGGCAVHPAASGGAAGFALLFVGLIGVRRRRAR